jgi:hypothetical protein
LSIGVSALCSYSAMNGTGKGCTPSALSGHIDLIA